MKHTKSYKFNPDKIKSVDDIVAVSNEKDYFWCKKSLTMADGSVHEFICWKQRWFEYNDLDDILRIICDNLCVLKDFIDGDAVIEE